jgi:hypothetical protein
MQAGMVTAGHSLTARKVMEEVFESMTGAKPVIKKTRCDLPRVERAAWENLHVTTDTASTQPCQGVTQWQSHW